MTMSRSFFTFATVSLLLLGSLPDRVSADQILKTSGFSTCMTNSTISVLRSAVEYNNDNKKVTFDLAGSSTKSMNVSAELRVLAYGIEVYKNSFNPCDKNTFVAQLCPVPKGNFSAKGVQTIPDIYAKMIPAIAFSIPDIAAQAKIELKTLDTGIDVACIQSTVNNGKTVNVPAVPYVAASIAGAALVLTGASAIGAAMGGASIGAAGAGAGGGGGGGGAGTISPSFIEVVGWFQGMAMNGMMSANLPPIYRSFTKNFAFSTGLVSFTAVQEGIDKFRGMTGGNLTSDSVAILQKTTLVFQDGTNNSATAKVKRAFVDALLYIRDELATTTDANSTAAASTQEESLQKTVSGITGFAEQLMIPKSNTFLTVSLVAAVLIVAIIVGILLFKTILEGWALFGSFPKGLIGFRKHYWQTMARTIVNLILVLYGVWVLYCIFQFTQGDSWAAQVLAGVSLAVFTAVLGFFILKIWTTARTLKKADGDTDGLYDDKDIWLKYSIFYDSYKRGYWWLFIPVIVYMLAKGIILAGLNGKGLPQAIAQLIVEALMLGLLVWQRPFERKSGNVINIIIQIVRVLSIVCILVFVEELGVAQTTQTVTGLVLIVVQSVLTGALAILIAVNAIILCCKKNPHRQRRKELEALNRENDNLTPLDARNSLLNPNRLNATNTSSTFLPKQRYSRSNETSYNEKSPSDPANPYSGRPYNAPQHRVIKSSDSQVNLMVGAAPMGGRSMSPPRGAMPWGGNGDRDPRTSYRGLGY